MDSKLISQTYACRVGKGNGPAVCGLRDILKRSGDYWALKLDVRQYFASINHRRLLGKLCAVLPDESLVDLVRGLLKNHPECQHGVGLPLGNLTSQVFANLYLNDLDQKMQKLLGDRYFRYMDDMIFVAHSAKETAELKAIALSQIHSDLLQVPLRKRVVLGNSAAIPFLGFLVHSTGKVTPLARNRRRHLRRYRKKQKRQSIEPSQLAMTALSYQGWEQYVLK